MKKLYYDRPETELIAISGPMPLCISQDPYGEGDEGEWIDDE